MNTYTLISIGILSLGFLICISLILWGKRKQTKGIDSYKTIRDKLTVREPEPEEESGGGGINLGNLIGGFIVILIGISLIGPVTEEVNTAQGNLTGATSTILGLTTLFFALAIVVVAITLVTLGLRNSGVI